VAVGQQDERMIDAQLRAPLIEGQAELVMEQSAEGARAGAGRPAELGQRGVVGGLVVQDLCDGPQPVIARLRQLQRLLGRRAELVDENPAQPGARGAVPVGSGPVVVAGAGEGEQGFAGEVIDREHGGVVRHQPGQGGRQEEDPHIGLAVGAVMMGEPGGRPRDPVGGHDRGAAFGVHRQDALGRVHQVPARVGIRLARPARRPQVHSSGRPQARGLAGPGKLAANGHSLAS
jgi:hypothetical protein